MERTLSNTIKSSPYKLLLSKKSKQILFWYAAIISCVPYKTIQRSSSICTCFNEITFRGQNSPEKISEFLHKVFGVFFGVWREA